MRGDKHPKASEFWLSTYAMSFAEIVNKSNCNRNFVEYQYVIGNPDLSNSIIKPVNDYAYNLYKAPEIIKYEDGYVFLRQKTHAEIWVKRDYKQGFYFLDRPHIRQFYTSDTIFKAENTFMMPYRFYVPWFIDNGSEFEVLQVNDEYSPFVIKENLYDPINTNSTIIEPAFVHFLFKKTGEHMLNPSHGKISIGTPMFDIKIKMDKREFVQLNDFYKKYKFSKF
jgi:hypothetical protein